MKKWKAASILSGLLAGPVWAEHVDVATPLLLYSAGAGADLITTRMALNAGGQELNPLMRGSLGKQAAIKSGMVLGVTLLDLHLQKQGRKKAAWVVRLSWLALHSAVAIHNSKQLK